MATKQKTNPDHDEIAGLARHIWQLEGYPPGRDREIWLQAEQLILIASQPESDRTTSATAKSNGLVAKGKKARPAARGANQFRPARPAAAR